MTRFAYDIEIKSRSFHISVSSQTVRLLFEMNLVLLIAFVGLILPIKSNEIFSAIVELENLVSNEHKILVEMERLRLSLESLQNVLAKYN